MYGLTKEEVKFIVENIPDLSQQFENNINMKNLDVILTELYFYLETDDCMWYDKNGENWYTKKGVYTQSLYDKMLKWKYEKNI